MSSFVDFLKSFFELKDTAYKVYSFIPLFTKNEKVV